MTTEHTLDPGHLAFYYEGWPIYQGYLVAAIAPLTAEQLALRASPNLRPIADLAAHIVGARARWYHSFLGEGGDALAPWAALDRQDPASHTVADLVAGLEATWEVMAASLARWTPADLGETVTRERRGETHTLSRGWVIWHLIEHDLHHGGELFLTCGMHGLPVPDL